MVLTHTPGLVKSGENLAKETIEEKILKYLKEGNRINQWNSYELFQYTRLSATIFNLRAKGYVIKKEWKKTPNGKRYKDYWLVEPEAVSNRLEKEETVQEGFGFNVKKRFEWPD